MSSIAGDHSDLRAPQESSAGGKIAYLTGHYPMVSHTFILREIAALRGQGLSVLPCSIRRPRESELSGNGEIAALKETFYVVASATNALTLLIAHLTMFAESPRRWLSAFALAWKTRPPGLKALIWQFFYFLEAGVLGHHLRRKGVVHIHNHFGDSSGSVAMLTSSMAGIPFSFTLHGPSIFFEPKWWRIDEKIARARFVVCISHFARSQAMLFSDQAHWDKLRIVHCGVAVGAYGKGERSTFAERVVFIGRLDSVKGVTLLLDAFARAKKSHPLARLIIIGDGPARPLLETQAFCGGFASNIQFQGYRSQEAVAEILANDADLLVLPSFAEGVPVVLMEAMASGLPVIASQVGGVPELVEDGVSGFLVPPGDLETLVTRLKALLADPALCARMGQAGRARVVADFDVEIEASRLTKLFKHYTSGRDKVNDVFF